MITPVSKLVERGNEIAKIEAEYEQSMAEYEQSHEEWLDSWWNGGASFEDAPPIGTAFAHAVLLFLSKRYSCNYNTKFKRYK